MGKWKRDAEVFHTENSAMLEGHFHTVETNMVCLALLLSLVASHVQFRAKAKGEDRSSLAATLIREAERNKLSSKERSWLAGTL